MTFTKQQELATGKRKAAEEEPTPSKKVIIQPHFIENRGPYPYNQPKKYVLYTLVIDLVWNNEHTESVALFVGSKCLLYKYIYCITLRYIVQMVYFGKDLL